MAGLIKNYRMILMHSQWPQWFYLSHVLIFSTVMLLISAALIKKFDHLYPSICQQ
jgi:ABC-type polysaccharide/polyol phosphate export permease